MVPIFQNIHDHNRRYKRFSSGICLSEIPVFTNWNKAIHSTPIHTAGSKTGSKTNSIKFFNKEKATLKGKTLWPRYPEHQTGLLSGNKAKSFAAKPLLSVALTAAFAAALFFWNRHSKINRTGVLFPSLCGGSEPCVRFCQTFSF